MTLLQVRDVPDATRRELKARAAARGQSLNSYLLDLLAKEVSRPTVAEVIERAKARAERASESSLDVILTARDEREEQFTRRSA